jgi:hypothetical protein
MSIFSPIGVTPKLTPEAVGGGKGDKVGTAVGEACSVGVEGTMLLVGGGVGLLASVEVWVGKVVAEGMGVHVVLAVIVAVRTMVGLLVRVGVALDSTVSVGTRPIRLVGAGVKVSAKT